MDYKSTLNLPRTDFLMKADLVKREPERLAKWEKDGLYGQIQKARSGATPFILHDGPPFANGDVHVGTAANKILKDFIIKYHSLRGKHAPYVPGWDCHGLPIEFRVSQDMRKAGATDSDPVSIRTACEAYARKYIDIQRTQFKRLGVLGDWENPYLTLNKEYEADELRLFADIVDKGFVYRGKKPVYWSIPCRTALAEAEVEYQDHTSRSVYVKFPVVGESNTSVLIWTTTPWTLPANLAVAYNSTLSYSMVLVADQCYLLSTMLLPTVAKKCGWESYQILRSVDGRDLGQLRCQHPFINREAPLYEGDSFVEDTAGTGFVHIAPGHGLEDYGVGLKNGLPVYSPVDDDGRLQHTSDLPVEKQMPEELIGKAILPKAGKSEANEAVIALLRDKQHLVHEENHVHSYPHCWRSKTPVIFRAMDQWFIRIDHEAFRERALSAVNQVRWIPDWGRNRIEGAVKVRPDWCISRQRTWGVPIPAFYDSEGNSMLDARIVRGAADLVEIHGSNVWFEKSVSELWSLLKPAGWSGPEAVAKSTDTLDVWIDSGSSSRAVLMRRPELQHSDTDGSQAPAWQADMYLEGSDQHRGWFQSSLLLSLAGNDAPPYRTVFTHGFMVDADRQKISKSKQGQGGYEKPQTAEAYVAKYGADILRLWVASQDCQTDIIVSEERLNKVAEAYRLIRNTLRYQLSNLFDFDPAVHSVPDEALTGLDRWILDRLSALERDVAASYDAYQFHAVYQRVTQFAAVELSSIYHDTIKDRLYTDPAGSARRRSSQTALHHLVSRLCCLLSPILAYTADEAWEAIPGRRTDSVHLADWSPGEFATSDTERATWARLFELRELVLPELEKKREAKEIGKALEASVRLEGGADALSQAAAHTEALRELINISELTVAETTGTRTGDVQAPTIGVVVEKAAGTKCDRCWHWEDNVGSSTSHPTLCGRCITAVETIGTAPSAA
ncbi:MAG: isoleucine--tRNA ligase [Verrucomicrobia bacterium]|nr:isoleucine--tRNA ligase [Verrucomicrobiota bacterium]